MEDERIGITHADRLGMVCADLREAEGWLAFICKQVADGKMTPEMALLKLHVRVLPDIVSAHRTAVRVKDELEKADKDRKEEGK